MGRILEWVDDVVYMMQDTISFETSYPEHWGNDDTHELYRTKEFLNGFGLKLRVDGK